MTEHAASPVVLVYATTERARAWARAALPRRRVLSVFARNHTEFSAALRKQLVDAAIVEFNDNATSTDETWRIAGLAADFPSVAFFGLQKPGLASDPCARAVELGFADMLSDATDEGCARELIAPMAYTIRFAEALSQPPAALGFSTDTQRKTWSAIVGYAGRPVTTSELAKTIGVTREHLSRNFARNNAPNLKRVIDLVRLMSAAELAKNPGYDIRDIAAVLGFASSSHLAVTTNRIAGTRPASLSSLRAVDLIERFTRGHTRSRVAGGGGL